MSPIVSPAEGSGLRQPAPAKYLDHYCQPIAMEHIDNQNNNGNSEVGSPSQGSKVLPRARATSGPA
jgi:hypothetical protein